MSKVQSGVWCVHCETITLTADVPDDEDGHPCCPHCGAGFLDLWDVRGPHIWTGLQIATASDELASVHVQGGGLDD